MNAPIHIPGLKTEAEIATTRFAAISVDARNQLADADELLSCLSATIPSSNDVGHDLVGQIRYLLTDASRILEWQR